MMLWVSNQLYCQSSGYDYRAYDANAPKKRCFVISVYFTCARYNTNSNINNYIRILEEYETRPKQIIQEIQD